jgi:MFS family permease
VLDRLRGASQTHSRQFWILFWGSLISSAGSAVFWPFRTIYLREQLGAPLTAITLLYTLNSAAGLAAMMFAGPAVDRFGRKRAMVLGLVGSGLVLVAMSLAQSMGAWALLLALAGALMPIYRVGATAMVADLTPPAQRSGAYALLRVANNAGIAIGPAVGGFVTSIAYTLAFYIAAAAQLLFAGIVTGGVQETLSEPAETPGAGAAADRSYAPVLRDRPFVVFTGICALSIAPAALMMMLLAVYAKENFGVMENQFGFIMATNAAMVVLFQYSVTRVSRRYAPLRVMALGALFYALGVGSVALGQGFWAFWLSMVIVTCGELLLMPTAEAFAANMAPATMRGRYLGLFAMTWGIAAGIGPVIGGWLNDNVAPVAIWYAGVVFGLLAMAGFLALGRRLKSLQPLRSLPSEAEGWG